MALGGGTFVTQNKVLPGTYINFVAAARASATLSERGFATMPIQGDWGEVGKVIEVTTGDLQKNSVRLFGYDYTAPQLRPLRELFKNIRIGYLFRLGTGGTKASNIYGTTRYAGERGNAIKIIVQENADDETKKDVSVLMDETVVAYQSVTAASELVDDDSNHGDPNNWFPKHGKSMDTFRAEVKRLLDGGSATPVTPPNPAEPSTPAVIQKGNVVKIAEDATYYDGKEIPAWVKGQNWVVSSVSKDRAVIDKNESGTNSICSPVNVKFISVAGDTPTPAPTYETYTVVKGDTLWGIAKAKLGEGERYPEIKALNGLTSDVIKTGLKLKIPLK